MVLYQLLFGIYPFFGLTIKELYECIKAKSGDNLPMPADVELSAPMKKLLRGFLEMDPDKRISWSEFFDHQIFETKKSPGRGKQRPAPRIHSEKVSYESRAPLQTVYAFDQLRSGTGDKGSSRGAQVFSTRDIFRNVKKNQKRHASNKQRLIQSKFHSQKNTPKLHHDKYTLPSRKDLSAERESTYSFLTGNRNYAETTLTRRNFFERGANRHDESQDVSPWERSRSKKHASMRSWTRYGQPPSVDAKRGAGKTGTRVSQKREADKSRKLEFASREMPSRVRAKEGQEHIDKSYIAMKEVVSRMSDRHVAQENYYFFCHQINKVLFLMRVARDSLDFLSRPNRRRAPRPAPEPEDLHDSESDEPATRAAERGSPGELAGPPQKHFRAERLRAILHVGPLREADHEPAK